MQFQAPGGGGEAVDPKRIPARRRPSGVTYLPKLTSAIHTHTHTYRTEPRKGGA